MLIIKYFQRFYHATFVTQQSSVYVALENGLCTKPSTDHLLISLGCSLNHLTQLLHAFSVRSSLNLMWYVRVFELALKSIA